MTIQCLIAAVLTLINEALLPFFYIEDFLCFLMHEKIAAAANALLDIAGTTNFSRHC